MKLRLDAHSGNLYGSLPVRGAWVEIKRCIFRSVRIQMSLPVRGAWVEMA